MLDFLRSEGIDEEMLARIEDFRRSFPAAPENAGRIPCPKYKYYGCEVWRDLDWMLDDEKVIFDVSAHENLKAALLGVFDSQIAGGKRYDAATAGRRLANATFSASHAVDTATSLAYAMDLTPLVENPELDMAEYAVSYLDHLRADIVAKINRVSK